MTSCCPRQILEASAVKTTDCSASYLPSHKPMMSKICWSLLVKRRQTHERYFLMDPIQGHTKIYIHQLSADTGCHQGNYSRAIDDRDKWREKERKSCCWPTVMMMMIAGKFVHSTDHLGIFLAGKEVRFPFLFQFFILHFSIFF